MQKPFLNKGLLNIITLAIFTFVFYSFNYIDKKNCFSTLKFIEKSRKIELVSQNKENLKFKIVFEGFNIFLNLNLETEAAILTIKDNDIVTNFNFTYDTDLESSLKEIKILKSSSSNDIILFLPVATEEFTTYQLILFESQQKTVKEALFEIDTHNYNDIKKFYSENSLKLFLTDNNFEIILGNFKRKGKFTNFKE